MVYVALLRGVNVGGKSLVNMKELKAAFEDAGMASVRTYINSGNVVFSSNERSAGRLTGVLERAIEEHLGLRVPVLVRSEKQVRSIATAIPAGWANDEAAKCDVLFLWPDDDSPAILERIPHDPAIDDLRYTPGAVIRRVARKDAPKSKLTRMVGTPLYQRLTIRNCNTARTLLALMEAARQPNPGK
jgi:uncharacterized protein (DUF1697 family)